MVMEMETIIESNHPRNGRIYFDDGTGRISSKKADDFVIINGAIEFSDRGVRQLVPLSRVVRLQLEEQ